ncbi:phosphotransferase [Streptomyces sp. NPDC020875]|uniref:phosphotransferase enzyme family protein n=1 Tax=Streptomyces sp. NPDC020875 TaxID=3154898 RepID=UPI0033E5D5DD
MMPLTEISELARHVDDEWRSPVADTVAARWGFEPGAARWWRSSATHVFAVPDHPEPDAETYLRFVPERYSAYERFETVARLMRTLRERGLAIVPVLPSVDGRLVERVETPLGAMRAMCIGEAPGDEVELEELTVARARAWGGLLARTHEAAADLTDGLDRPLDGIAAVADLYPDDAELGAAVAKVAARLTELPRDPAAYGVVHGDFELDNLAWDGDTPVAFDFDEAALSWYAADVAHAIRDLTDHGRPCPAHAESLTAFLAGYREVRPLPCAEPAELLLLAGANAARSLIELRPVLATLDEGKPDDLDRLRADLLEHRDEQRAVVIAAATSLPGSGDTELPSP